MHEPAFINILYVTRDERVMFLWVWSVSAAVGLSAEEVLRMNRERAINQYSSHLSRRYRPQKEKGEENLPAHTGLFLVALLNRLFKGFS